MNILIADDHQAIVNGYRTIISSAITNTPIYFSQCFSCEDTYLSIEKNFSENKMFDLALVDYSMPAYAEKKITSGGDLCLYIKKIMPDCKVFIITAVSDNITLFDIVQNVKPDGIALKSDISHHNLPEIINSILEGRNYRSESIIEKNNEIWKTNTFVNEQNRKILYYLSLGYKIKDISSELYITEGAVQKRLTKIKKGLGITDDSSILKETKKRGYI